MSDQAARTPVKGRVFWLIVLLVLGGFANLGIFWALLHMLPREHARTASTFLSVSAALSVYLYKFDRAVGSRFQWLVTGLACGTGAAASRGAA